MSYTRRRRSASTSPGSRPTPSTQKRTVSSAAASRSPSMNRRTSSLPYATTSSDQPAFGRPGPTSTSAVTSCGRASVASSATPPPTQVPTSTARALPPDPPNPEANGRLGAGVQVAHHEPAHLLAAVRHDLVRPAGLRQTWAHQHQRRDQLRTGQRRLERDATAQRVPDQRRPF